MSLPGIDLIGRTGLVACLLMISGGALGQTDVRISSEESGSVTRIEIVYPEDSGGSLQVDASIVAGAVLQARFSEPIQADASALADLHPDLIARARIDTDGSILRIALIQEIEPRVSISHNMVAIDLAPPGSEPLPDIVSPHELAQRRAAALAREEEARLAEDAARPLPALPVDVAYGEATEYTRIEFIWPETVDYSLDQVGQTATLRFERAADSDLSELMGRMPRLVESIVNNSDERSFSLSFDLANGVEARAWDEGERVVLDLMDPSVLETRELLAALEDYAEAQTVSEEETLPEDEALSADIVEVSGPAPLQPDSDDSAPAEDTAVETLEEDNLSTAPSPDTPEPVDVAATDDPVVPDRVDTPLPIDPVPEDGIVRGDVTVADTNVILTFEWEALPGAALYKRGGAYWLVFDASAALLIDPLDELAQSRIVEQEAWRGDTFSALRLVTSQTTQIDIEPSGSDWILTFTDILESAPRSIILNREIEPREPARIDINLDSIRSIVDFMDPLVGDVLWIVTSDGPKSGVITERSFLEASFLPSVQGLAIRPLADDLTIAQVTDGARMSRPGGLALTRPLEEIEEPDSVPVSPAAFDFVSWRGTHPFREERQLLSRAASDMDPDALIALAQFYLAHEMGPEALGALDLTVQARPRLSNDPRVNAMRGAASYMMARYDDARRYFTVPQLINDASVQNWLGLIAVEQSNWAEARRRFAAGEDSFFYLSPLWRARIHAANARASLEANDLAAAELGLLEVDEDITDPLVRSEVEFIRARLIQARGDADQALQLYEALAHSEWEPIQARALLEKTRLEFAEDMITPSEGVEQLESLRYRWRGDRTEILASRLLGELYAEAGHYSEALGILDSARLRDPGSSLSRSIHSDMDALFRRLFIDDEASRMDILEAVALWYEYSDLTPQGEEGQRMVRRIAERLVAVDLLDPAAELLEHQVFELTSITAFAKAQIASDLAVIYLMADRHEDALRALQRTRITGLTRDIVTERRLLEARALSGLGRMDHALELISMDRGPEADRLRADIAWERREWTQTGRQLEAILANRWQEAEPLTPSEAHDVLRASISYTLAEDELSVARLRNRFGSAMADTRFASAFDIVVSEIDGGRNAQIVDLVNELGEMEPVDSFMAGFVQRFETGAES